MPVKKSVYNITEVIGKRIKSGIPTYLIRYADGNSFSSKWLNTYEIPSPLVKNFDVQLAEFNALLRKKRLERRNMNKMRVEKGIKLTVKRCYFSKIIDFHIRVLSSVDWPQRMRSLSIEVNPPSPPLSPTMLPTPPVAPVIIPMEPILPGLDETHKCGVPKILLKESFILLDNSVTSNPIYAFIPPCSVELKGSKAAKAKHIIMVIPQEYVRSPVAIEITNPHSQGQEEATIAELTYFTEAEVHKKKFAEQAYKVIFNKELLIYKSEIYIFFSYRSQGLHSQYRIQPEKGRFIYKCQGMRTPR